MAVMRSRKGMSTRRSRRRSSDEEQDQDARHVHGRRRGYTKQKAVKHGVDGGGFCSFDMKKEF